MKKILSILGHRMFMVALLLLVQIGLLMAVLIRFNDYFVYVYFFCVALSVIAVLYIVNRRMDPGYKIGWIILILFAPFFGGLFYLICGGNGPSRRLRRKLEGMNKHMADALSPDKKAQTLAPFGPDAVNQSRYLEEYAHCPLYANTVTRYFPVGDDAFAPMLAALRGAEKYIFLEYFIITPGKFWNSILEILEEKVAAGVDVRVI